MSRRKIKVTDVEIRIRGNNGIVPLPLLVGMMQETADLRDLLVRLDACLANGAISFVSAEDAATIVQIADFWRSEKGTD